MFERLEIYLEKMIFGGADPKWSGKAKILITYDEIQNKTYCYYENAIDPWHENPCDPENEYFLTQNNFSLQGNDLVKEIETTNFRNWYELVGSESKYFGHTVICKIKYNDLNGPTKTIELENGVPTEFFLLFSILEKYFIYTEFFKVKQIDNFYEIYCRNILLFRAPISWNDKVKSKQALKNLTRYIDIFKGKKKFGTWKKAYHSFCIYYIPEVYEFKKEVMNIIQQCRDLYLDWDIEEEKNIFLDLQLLEYEKDSIAYKKLLINNKAAIQLLLFYIDEYLNSEAIESKKLEEALKDGTIVNILEFIKEYNHF